MACGFVFIFLVETVCRLSEKVGGISRARVLQCRRQCDEYAGIADSVDSSREDVGAASHGIRRLQVVSPCPAGRGRSNAASAFDLHLGDLLSSCVPQFPHLCRGSGSISI